MDKSALRRTIACAILALTLVVATGCSRRVYNDGTFKGISDADRHGYAVAEVTIKGDKITDVKLTEITEMGVVKDYATYPYKQAQAANQEMAKRFVAKNSPDVDIYTGATNSSNKYKQAVSRALERAKVKPTVTGTYFDGTFLGVSKADDHGFGVAWVTLSGGKIVKVELDEVTEKNQFKDWANYPYDKAKQAKVEMAKRFVEKNSADVDVFTGATSSSKKWKEAVANALNLAKFK